MALGLIGREYQTITRKDGSIHFAILKNKPLFLDFSEKQHIFICAKSGSGKSYLAGVIAEEITRHSKNMCVVILDPMGIFETLDTPNDQKLVDEWNSQLDSPDVIPKGIRILKFIPAGDKDKFDPDTYDQTFAIRPRDFGPGSFCYTFDIDPLEPQVNLYRKAQKTAFNKNPDFTIQDLEMEMTDNGDFNPQTKMALKTKLDALIELGILTNEGKPIQQIVQEGKIIVLDLSMSNDYTSRILVDYFANTTLYWRKKVFKQLLKAEKDKCKISMPDYICPVHLIIDEANWFFHGSTALKYYIKKGRNCGCILTAISQSPDLTRDLYSNITHLFIGQITYDDDLDAIRHMMPFIRKPQEFAKQIKNLGKGCFLYCNSESKQEVCIKVRVRQSLHPAETKLQDEHQFLNAINTGELSPELYYSDFEYDPDLDNSETLIDVLKREKSVKIPDLPDNLRKQVPELVLKKQAIIKNENEDDNSSTTLEIVN
jgi:uncharacterized protein